ncbi:MAG: cation:proton antiporter [Rectinema sp.]|jgi:Kef-type K+ transport system membrane component KefB/mannitol/fructose-specific phosphotransferase system IIA component (Ntr-type)/nucleotide-binding universal stress UspA family protein
MNVIHDPVGIFALLLASVLFSAWLSNVFRFNIAVILLIFGIIAGPEVAGLLDSGAVLQILGSIGIVYVFFFAGLSTRISTRFPRHDAYGKIPFNKRSPQFFVWTVIPALTGIAIGFVIGKSPLQAAAIGIFFASAGIASSLEENYMKFSSLESYGLPGSVSLLVVFVLLALDAVAGGADARRCIFVLASGCILAGVIWSLFPRLASIFLRRIKSVGVIEGWFLFFLVFTASYAASFLSIPNWFTAYIAGIALSSAAMPTSGSGTGRILLKDDIFSPAAFFLMGVSIHISEFSSNTQWLVWGGIFIAGGLAARMLVAFFSKRIALMKGPMLGLAVPFTTFSLAISWILYSSGIFDAPLFMGAIALALVTGIISNSLMKKASSAAKVLSSNPTEKAAFVIPNRILIALSKPSSIPHLLELGAILHGADNRSPLFPLVVHSPEDSEIAQSAGSETILATAVMKLSGMQKSVLPLNVEAINPGLGILESAIQKNADTIVIGWNKPPRLAHAFFGNIIDQIVSGSNSMVLVARGRFPWKSSKQILAIFPPLVDMHSGYEAALQCIKRFARASFATLHCFIPKDYEEQLADLWKITFSSINYKISTFSTWREIPDLFQKAATVHAAIVLVSARPGEASWSPAFERLPHILAENLPEANVLMLYMPSYNEQREQPSPQPAPPVEVEAASSPQRAEASNAEALLLESVRAGRIQVNMQGSALAEGIYKIIFSAFPNGEKKQLRALADHCIEMLQRQPIEIEPGVVLLHDRLENIPYPMVCFGAQKTGYRLSALESPVQIIVLILVPVHQSADEHLRFLADIAALFRMRNLRQRLMDANEPEDLLSYQ